SRDRLGEAVSHRLELARQQLDQLTDRWPFRRPLERIRTREQGLDELAGRLHRAAKVRLSRAAEKLAALAGQLETLSPLNVLQRGYSLTHNDDGRLVRSAAGVRPGDRLVSRVADGEVVSRVEDTRPAPR